MTLLRAHTFHRLLEKPKHDNNHPFTGGRELARLGTVEPRPSHQLMMNACDNEVSLD